MKDNVRGRDCWGQWAMLCGRIREASLRLPGGWLVQKQAGQMPDTSLKPAPRPPSLPVGFVLFPMSLDPRMAAGAQGQNAIEAAGRRLLGAEIQ